ncbi:hypothetical protein GCM10010293_60640 [Streptomyces griseoflavus]|nr:hypothetical protein GCM10010293_60640 [Streptomyces griseoflavus]
MALTDVLPVHSRPPTSYISLKGGLTFCQCVTSRNGQLFGPGSARGAALTCEDALRGRDRSHPGGDWITKRPGPRDGRDSGLVVHTPCTGGYRAVAAGTADVS